MGKGKVLCGLRKRGRIVKVMVEWQCWCSVGGQWWWEGRKEGLVRIGSGDKGGNGTWGCGVRERNWNRIIAAVVAMVLRNGAGREGTYIYGREEKKKRSGFWGRGLGEESCSSPGHASHAWRRRTPSTQIRLLDRVTYVKLISRRVRCVGARAIS